LCLQAQVSAVRVTGLQCQRGTGCGGAGGAAGVPPALPSHTSTGALRAPFPHHRRTHLHSAPHPVPDFFLVCPRGQPAIVPVPGPPHPYRSTWTASASCSTRSWYRRYRRARRRRWCTIALPTTTSEATAAGPSPHSLLQCCGQLLHGRGRRDAKLGLLPPRWSPPGHCQPACLPALPPASLPTHRPGRPACACAAANRPIPPRMCMCRQAKREQP
jgi:hypothetical protein